MYIVGIYVFMLSLVIETRALSVQCMDENGKEVDWYVAYKFPEIKNHSNKLVRQGSSYAFISSDMADGKSLVLQGMEIFDPKSNWILSTKGITSKDSIAGHTLSVLYDKSQTEELLYILYNDQPPNKKVSFDKGHTKGVFVLGPTGSGFWLIHSIPHFPTESKEGYQYPSSGHLNGQAFFCISFSEKEADDIGMQLLYNDLYIYEANVPAGWETRYPNLAAVVKNTTVMNPPWSRHVQLQTLKGDPFISFAKDARYHNELYGALVAPTLHAGLFTQTWMNGRNPLPSDCKDPYKVLNIEELSFPFPGVSYMTKEDHSKWAISSNLSTPWVCIGDINRMAAQEKRGGGTACIQNRNLWNQFAQAIVQLEPCH